MVESTGRRLLLGVTGGIAAYKAAELVRLLLKEQFHVEVAMTAAACGFVTPATFQALSGHPVWTDMWDARAGNAMAHIELSRDKDALLVAPASANFLAKLAHGLADDLLSTLCLARDCPLLVAPAMNRQMWEHPATQRNIALLRQDSVQILGPDSGDQACGETGFGRMLEPEELAGAVAAFLRPKPLQGVRVLVTAGPTFEAIDAVRGVTNRSSGKMGFAVARAAQEAGAEVTMVAGPVAQPTPSGVTRVDVISAREMLDAVMQRIGQCDMFIGVAAVSDYGVAQAREQKIKKTDQNLNLELIPNPDILAEVAGLPNPPFCVGFAAESENLLEFAEAKRRRKKLPLLAANLVQHAVGAEESELILLDDGGSHGLPKAPKTEQARRLLVHAAQLYSTRMQRKGKS